MLLFIIFSTLFAPLSIVLVELTRYFYFKNKRYVIKYEDYGIKLYYTIGEQTKGDTWLKNKYECPTFTYKEGCLQIKYLNKIYASDYTSDYFTLERVFRK